MLCDDLVFFSIMFYQLWSDVFCDGSCIVCARGSINCMDLCVWWYCALCFFVVYVTQVKLTLSLFLFPPSVLSFSTWREQVVQNTKNRQIQQAQKISGTNAILTRTHKKPFDTVRYTSLYIKKQILRINNFFFWQSRECIFKSL